MINKKKPNYDFRGHVRNGEVLKMKNNVDNQ